MQSLYHDYLEGEHDLDRNERQQLGLRLARSLGHQRVYSVDADGDFPLPRLQDYVEARGHAEEYEAVMDDFRAWSRAWDEYRASHTLLEALRYVNSDDYVARLADHDCELARFAEPWNWAGPDLLSDWFRRNARIYGNIVHLIDSPAGERRMRGREPGRWPDPGPSTTAAIGSAGGLGRRKSSSRNTTGATAC